jgi:catechol 2,3-dioxygenase-like lactoylglutathione lyase family enzyme
MWKTDHVAFEVSDMDAAVSFYVGKLGMEILSEKVDEEHREHFLFLKLEGANLELLQTLDERNRPQLPVKKAVSASFCPHLAIAVENLDVLMNKLHRVGIPVLKGPLEIAGQVRWLYVADPDQNILEFVQWEVT